MRVLRIETLSGAGLYGAYNGGSDYNNSLAHQLVGYFAFKNVEHQPPPGEDGLTPGFKEPDMIYGFDGIREMRDWLGACPIELIYAKSGHVIELEVPTDKVESGYSQCRFYPDDVVTRKALTLQEIQQEYTNGNVQRLAA